MKSKLASVKKGSALWWIGLWATVWWAVSGAYLVLIVWLAIDDYVALNPDTVLSLSDWQLAIHQASEQNPFMNWLLLFIIFVWIIGGIMWLSALKKAKISYKEGFKDLFLTLR